MEDLAKAGKADAAITQLEREIGSNPFLTRALFTLASLYATKNQNEKATATLMRVLQVEPKNPLAYNNLGMIQLKLKRYNEAVLFLEKACDYAPKNPEPWLNMGIAYERLGKFPSAILQYREALAADPEHVGAREALATLESGEATPAASAAPAGTDSTLPAPGGLTP